MATMTNTEKLPFTLTILNDAGLPATVDGVPTYASSDETVLTLELAADGLSGFVVSGAPGGPARVTVTVDADLGAGVVTRTGVSEDITVTLDQTNLASVFNFTFGPAVAKA